MAQAVVCASVEMPRKGRRGAAALVSGLLLLACLALAARRAPLRAARREVVLAEEAAPGSLSKAVLEEAELARAQERVLGIKAALAAQQPSAAPHGAPAVPNAAPRSQAPPALTRIERQLAEVRELRSHADAAVQDAIRDRQAEARMKAALQAEIDSQRPAGRPGAVARGQPVPEITVAVDAARRPVDERRASHTGDSAAAKDIREWRAQQSAAWEKQKRKDAAAERRLARMEKADRPEIRQWREQQTRAWKQAKTSLAQKALVSREEQRSIDLDLKREERQIRLWRDQQQDATRKWREKESEKVEDERVRKARLASDSKLRQSAHGHEQRVRSLENAARQEIKSITAKEMLQWNFARKGQALARIQARAASKKPAARKVAVGDDSQARETRKLERRQAEVQWKRLVKMAIGAPASARLRERERGLISESEQHPAMVNQNLAAYLRCCVVLCAISCTRACTCENTKRKVPYKHHA